jgi:hypothetical protein
MALLNHTYDYLYHSHGGTALFLAAVAIVVPARDVPGLNQAS